jgi:serine/threonine protein kinase/WD40 repeat protein
MRKPPLQRVEALFHQAADLPPEERPTFLDVHCGGNTALRSAVEELLKYDSGSRVSDGFLASPVARMVEASPAPVLPAIAGYEVLEELGRGGMGIVYKARQTALNRLVALKMLLAGPAVTSEQLARFRIEAEALARLQHPNIVQIFAVGEQEGRPYFAMEYVAGPSLAHQLRGTPQPAQSAAQLVEVVTRAVDAVHHCGIIHRDLKPANILLQRIFTAEDAEEPKGKPDDTLPLRSSAVKDFIPKVSDFGLAKLVNNPPSSRILTEPGQTLGTPSYMAPEQAWGKLDAVGPATDVYALGAILYELVTGRPPFEGETPTETILQLLFQEPVPPTRLRPALPRDLETICLKCLEKEPHRRYASALALAEDLHRLQAGEPIKARPLSKAERAYRWCRRRPLVAALLAITVSLALALVTTVLVYNARLQQALNESRQKAEDERVQLVQRDVMIGMRSLESGDALTALLWFTEALRLDERNLQQEENHRLRIAMALQRCPHLVQLLAPEGRVVGAQLSAAGPWMVVTCQDGTVRVWNVMTGQQAATDELLIPRFVHDHVVTQTQFSPNGRLVVTAGSDNQARVWEIATGRPLTPPLKHNGSIVATAFSADSTQLLTIGRDDTVRVWEVPHGDGREAGEAMVPAPIPPEESVGPSNRRITKVEHDTAVQVTDALTGAPVGPLLRHASKIESAELSPDGRRVLTASDDNTAQVWDAVSGERLIPPCEHKSTVRWAAFSPDGRRLITASDDQTVRVWDAGTGEPLSPPLPCPRRVVKAYFSLDADRAIAVCADGSARIWSLTADNQRVASLILLAQVLAGSRIDDKQGVLPLDRQSLRAAWHTLRSP